MNRVICIVVIGLAVPLSVAGCGGEKSAHDATIECRSPNGKRPSKVIPRWKYDRVREVILSFVTADASEILYADLKKQVVAGFSKADAMHIGNLDWYVDTVVLEMETNGELSRVPMTDTPLPKHVKRE